MTGKLASLFMGSLSFRDLAIVLTRGYAACPIVVSAVATRRSLWQGASSLNVQPYFDIHYSDVRCIVGELGSFSVDWLLGGLTRLPPEILKMIWDFCNDTWYCSVLDLARHVTAMQENNQLQDRIIPLLNVKTWVRGNAPQLEGSASGSIVRLAIDSRGLLCIERLTQLDRKISSRSDCMGYIVEAAERFNGVSVDFQVVWYGQTTGSD
ncbi:hypothetical protein H634G_10888 [Metarhizium anisopliae BRIP 53293]|uniref:Uncharacterized protein n=1 Tax=Metarhizium anisopliae BRIP 53293 TaxID=1291518 RepID=A0A0D9NIN4_METAN|nr:hypothetical protein H634G_10888 [Metarhizium anisopliae BRIP 53293]